MTDETMRKLAEQTGVFGGVSPGGLYELFKIVRTAERERAARLVTEAGVRYDWKGRDHVASAIRSGAEPDAAE